MTVGARLSEEELVRSPAWLPLEAADGCTVRMLCLDEAAYDRASFLDQRLLALGYPHKLCELALLEAAAARLAPRAHYIFHTGHVGSTLLSRLVGAHGELFSLREPALLRALVAQPPVRGTPGLEVALALLGRTWRANQRAVIKATSFVSELAAAMLAADERAAAICMFAHPRNFLRGILAGPNSRVETAQLAPARMQRLRRRLGAGVCDMDTRSEGESIAMSWLCEMTTLHQATSAVASRVLWVNFDAFLVEPFAGLEAVFRALGATAAAGEIRSLVQGPLMRQYSKAPQYGYDAALRRALLESADREHPGEIRRGMEWLRKVAMHHRLVATILERYAHDGQERR